MDKSKPDIYLVEDETDILDSLRLSFRIEGYGVVAWSNGADAKDFLEKLDSAENFVLISDILLPGISGIDVIRFAKQKFPHCPAIAITGHGDKPMVMELLRCGCDDFLDKPFDSDELLHIVEQVVELQKKRDEETLVRLRAVDTIQREFQPILDAYEREGVAGEVGGKKSAVDEEAVCQELQWSEGKEGISVAFENGVVKIKPGGDWVGKRSECLREKLEELLTAGERRIELHFGEVQDLDSLALGVLCSLSHELRSGGGSLSFHEVGASVARLFHYMNLSKEFGIVS